MGFANSHQSICCSSCEKEGRLTKCKSKFVDKQLQSCRGACPSAGQNVKDGFSPGLEKSNGQHGQSTQQTVKVEESSGYPHRTQFGVRTGCTQMGRVEKFQPSRCPCNLPSYICLGSPGSDAFVLRRSTQGRLLTQNACQSSLLECRRTSQGTDQMELTKSNQDAGKLHLWGGSSLRSWWMGRSRRDLSFK